MADRTFAKFTFFKIDPAWRRRDAELRAADKREFLAACEDFAIDRSLRAYSTIGTRGDVDIVLLSQSPNLDDLHTFHVVLGQSGLAKWAETPYSFLSMTKTLALLRGAARGPRSASPSASTCSSTRWSSSGAGTACPTRSASGS